MISVFAKDAVQNGYIIAMQGDELNQDSEYIYMGFGELIKYHRDRLHMSQKELAFQLGENQTTVSAWEARQRAVRKPFILSKLAEVFDVPYEDVEAGRLRRPEVAQREAEEEIKRLARKFVPSLEPEEALAYLRDLEAIGSAGRAEVSAAIEYYRWRQEKQRRTEGDNEAGA
jgi:transcriptional regulator with XRE-family HTH domain